MPRAFSGPQAADAQHELLLDARDHVAPVQLVGDVAVFVDRVFGDVGVQQKQRHTAHLHPPDLDVAFAPRKAELDDDLVAVAVQRRLHRPGEEVVDGILLHLPSVRVQVLFEIALLIQQPHADQSEIGVAGGLQIVARKDAEAAGIDLHGLEQSVLHREIRHADAAGRRLLRHVFVELAAGGLVLGHVARVGRRLLQGLLRHPPQHQHRIAAALLPHHRIEAAEDRADGLLPAPEKIEGKFAEPRQLRRKSRTHKEFFDRADMIGHAETSMIPSVLR